MAIDIDFTELTWAEARPTVQGVRPELADIIDKLDPSDDFTILKVRYPFGSRIFLV